MLVSLNFKNKYFMSKHFFKSTNKLFLNEKTGYFQSLIHLPYFIHLKYSINFKFVIDHWWLKVGITLLLLVCLFFCTWDPNTNSSLNNKHGISCCSALGSPWPLFFCFLFLVCFVFCCCCYHVYKSIFLPPSFLPFLLPSLSSSLPSPYSLSPPDRKQAW